MKKAFIVFSCLFVFSDGFGFQCGVWRRDVKILSDSDGAGILNKSVKKSTVDMLAMEKAPQKLTTRTKVHGRLSGESDLVKLDAFIVEYKKEDNDH